MNAEWYRVELAPPQKKIKKNKKESKEEEVKMAKKEKGRD